MKQNKFIVVLLLMAFVISSLAGCSGDKTPGEIPPEKLTPGQALTNYYMNMDAGNYTEASKFVSMRTAAENETDLPTFLAWLGGNAERNVITQIDILDETIDGAKATVKFRISVKINDKEESQEIKETMHQEDGVWKFYLNAYGHPKEKW